MQPRVECLRQLRAWERGALALGSTLLRAAVSGTNARCDRFARDA